MRVTIGIFVEVVGCVTSLAKDKTDVEIVVCKNQCIKHISITIIVIENKTI